MQAPILYNFDDFEQLEGFNTFQKKINVSIGMLLALVMGYSLSKFCENKKFTMSPGPHPLISNGDPNSET